MSPEIVRLCGVDLVLEASSLAWKIIELNDSPVGLVAADRLSATLGTKSIFSTSLVDTLAEYLVKKRNLGIICLLLPERFLLSGTKHVCDGRLDLAPSSYARHLVADSDQLLIEDLNAIAAAVRRRNARCVIADFYGVLQSSRSVYTADGDLVDVLFRKSHFPRQEPSCHCVNDIRAVNVCRDKFLTYKCLASGLGDNCVPRTVLLDQQNEAIDRNELRRCRYVISKPNFGYGSLDVARWRASDGIPHVRRGSAVTLNSPIILQEWIEPSIVQRGAFAYYYDVRIYVIGGAPLGGFARCAAGPTDLEPSDSPLQWLTTWGRRMALGAPGATDAVSLKNTQARSLIEISREAVESVDQMASRLDYETAFASRPDPYRNYRSDPRYTIHVVGGRL